MFKPILGMRNVNFKPSSNCKLFPRFPKLNEWAKHFNKRFFISVLQRVCFIPVPRGVHRHERPASSFPLQHFLLFPRQLQGNATLCWQSYCLLTSWRGHMSHLSHLSHYTCHMFQEELARTRELPVPPQPRRSGVLARSDDNLAGEAP